MHKRDRSNRQPVTPGRGLAALILCLFGAASPVAFAADHSAWQALLERHVRWNAAGVTTTVDYAGFAADRDELQTYLGALSAVPADDYARWSTNEQLAFLINAYNAFTVELILTRYPDLDSIRDLGRPLQSPWKRRFFELLGEERHLDELEHEMIRGNFDEPRIHFAVNCASIGCPALRPEAFTAAQLSTQLEDQTYRFLSDRSRNRFDADEGVLHVSRIFRWYGEDFRQGWRDTWTVQAFIGIYAAALADDAEAQARLRDEPVDIEYLSYDWRLNDGASG